MALALGANTAALSVLKAFLLSSLAVPESDRVVLIAPERDLPGRGSVIFSEAYPNWPTQLGASVVAQIARLTVPGVAVGLAVVWSGSGLLDAFVFGVQARSPAVLAGAGGVLLLLAVIATLPPALRAMRVDIRRGISG